LAVSAAWVEGVVMPGVVVVKVVVMLPVERVVMVVVMLPVERVLTVVDLPTNQQKIYLHVIFIYTSSK
jgi:hypothetical protein